MGRIFGTVLGFLRRVLGGDKRGDGGKLRASGRPWRGPRRSRRPRRATNGAQGSGHGDLIRTGRVNRPPNGDDAKALTLESEIARLGGVHGLRHYRAIAAALRKGGWRIHSHEVARLSRRQQRSLSLVRVSRPMPWPAPQSPAAAMGPLPGLGGFAMGLASLRPGTKTIAAALVAVVAGGLAGLWLAIELEGSTAPCLIKGDIGAADGRLVYYMPGDPDYNIAMIELDAGERWFCTETEAREAGWRPAI